MSDLPVVYGPPPAGTLIIDAEDLDPANDNLVNEAAPAGKKKPGKK